MTLCPGAPERHDPDALDHDGDPWPWLTYEAAPTCLEAAASTPRFPRPDRLERDTGWHCPIHGISYDGTYRDQRPAAFKWDQIKFAGDALNC